MPGRLTPLGDGWNSLVEIAARNGRRIGAKEQDRRSLVRATLLSCMWVAFQAALTHAFGLPSHIYDLEQRYVICTWDHAIGGLTAGT
jgi:hypothetical protein